MLLDIEGVGEKFNLNSYLKSRELCIQLLNQLEQNLIAGSNEFEVQVQIKKTAESLGITKFWHPSKFRIQSDTMKTFRATSDQSIYLKPGDICFLDLGPIVADHEADFGRTFIFAESQVSSDENLEPKVKLIQASHLIFKKAQSAWREQGLTGLELFEFTNSEAMRLGYQLNADMAGHRLGDFPHHVFSKQGLFSLNKKPIANLWVLEIHLIDEKNQMGAFFEDILM